MAAGALIAEEAGADVPDEAREAAELTPYAVAGRYPGPLRPVTDEEYTRALALAERVVRWAERAITGGEEA